MCRIEAITRTPQNGEKFRIHQNETKSIDAANVNENLRDQVWPRDLRNVCRFATAVAFVGRQKVIGHRQFCSGSAHFRLDSRVFRIQDMIYRRKYSFFAWRHFFLNIYETVSVCLTGPVSKLNLWFDFSFCILDSFRGFCSSLVLLILQLEL